MDSFTAQVKLHSILVRTSASGAAPRRLRLYPNRDDVDFEAAEELAPVQELELAQTSEVQEVPLKRALLSAVHRLALFFVDNHGFGDEPVSRIAYLGFRGEWTKLGRAPASILYEAVPQPGHDKLKGAALGPLSRGIDGGGGGGRGGGGGPGV